MCGIAGIRQFGADPIKREEIILLLTNLEHRGNHATGIALMNPDGVKVHKAPIPAWQFTKSKDFEEFLKDNLTNDTKTALLHTRAATIGNPEFNQNNHPLWDGRTAIVHNGHINNHNSLFQTGGFRRIAETDSDVIRAIVAKYGLKEKGIRELCKMDGSAAIACVDANDPETLLLARSGSPLIVGVTPTASKLYWASEPKAIIQASKPFVKVMGVHMQAIKSDVLLANMPDNTAWVFEGDQRTLHHEFNTCRFYRAPSYAGMYASYHSKIAGWKRDKKSKKNAEEARQREVKADKEQLEQIKQAVVKGSAKVTTMVSNRPLPKSLAVCGSCGCAVQNMNGVPWSIVPCPECGQKVIDGEE